MKKDDIRRTVKTQKSLLTDLEKKKAAAQVFQKLERTAAFLVAENILLYHSLPDELSTLEFIDRWSNRKNFFLPRVNGVNLDILPWDRTRLSLGAFHIEEPQGDDIHNVDEMELIIVPAIAYDRKGNRVGRGKGYYDRLLAEAKAIKIGIGYDFQLIDDDIEIEPHDVGVDIVITQSSTITIRTKR
ncbi:MAG: 5-formyltetrahydrofolate cyclo-ligase [Muribaculaceae bacterium]|nr:5-formyltetrahydrofolate cyclo-ligase [Muribaculaceae bacterium]